MPEDAEAGNLDDDMIVIGTREELGERVEEDIDPKTIDLHRPAVDDLTVVEDGTTYRRVEDVFDVWLDSSVASWGTLGYPSDETAHDELWPADFIVEAHDQTRGWFWSQLGMGTAAVGEIPYEEVLMHGFANDENGRKMSKSVGNIVTPEEAIERAGATRSAPTCSATTNRESTSRSNGTDSVSCRGSSTFSGTSSDSR